MTTLDKLVDLEKGRVMVVTDVHGNWRDYEQIMRTFDALRKKGEADMLVFTGDLVHGYPGYKDESKRVIDDLIKRRANQDGSGVVALLGNHDMVHIYHIGLSKGLLEFTSSFEKAIKENRGRYIDFFESMPFAALTSGGVLLNHAGASEIIGSGRVRDYGFNFGYFVTWPHEEILVELAKLAAEQGLPSHTDRFNAALGRIFQQKKRGKFLWDFLMNKNEREYGPEYHSFVPGFLSFMGTAHEPLTVMVNGHIEVPSGVEVVNPQQLRLSSSYGARSDVSKTFLLFDAAKKYPDAKALLPECHRLYS